MGVGGSCALYDICLDMVTRDGHTVEVRAAAEFYNSYYLGEHSGPSVSADAISISYKGLEHWWILISVRVLGPIPHGYQGMTVRGPSPFRSKYKTRADFV